jgi:hypothetical protein
MAAADAGAVGGAVAAAVPTVDGPLAAMPSWGGTPRAMAI